MGPAGPTQSPVLSMCPDRVSPAEPQTSPSVAAAAVIVAIRVAPARAFPDAHPVVVAIRIAPAHTFPDTAHLVVAIRAAAAARWTPVSPLPQQWLQLLLSPCSDFPLSVALLQVSKFCNSQCPLYTLQANHNSSKCLPIISDIK